MLLLALGEQQKYISILDKMISDTKNTMLLRFLKMYFIGSSGLGKSTTRNRLIGLITNLDSLPKGERKRRSTYLAECNQVLALMDENEAKLTLRASEDLDDETRMLFAYVYNHILHTDPPDSASVPVSDRPSTEFSEHPVARVDQTEITAQHSSTQTLDMETTGAASTGPTLKSKEMVVEDKVIARLRSIVASGKYAEQLQNKILINLVDVGGQPGFLEMLPFLSKGPGMFLAFSRLDKELDEPCEVSFERDDNRITPYKAIYTVRETLSQILSAINHHVTFDTASDQQFLKQLKYLASVKPVATLVGTFKDQLELKVKSEALHEKLSIEFPQALDSEKEEVIKLISLGIWNDNQPAANVNTAMQRSADQLLASESFIKEVKERLDRKIEEKNKAISTITCHFEDLLFHPADNQQFVALDNFKGTEADIDPLCEHLQCMFESFFKEAKLRIRPTQLLLGVILRKEYDIVSIDDCIRIGKALSMEEEEVKFFHMVFRPVGWSLDLSS